MCPGILPPKADLLPRPIPDYSHRGIPETLLRFQDRKGPTYSVPPQAYTLIGSSKND